MERLRLNNIKLNKDKTKFKKEGVNYIGHVVSKDGIKVDPEKVDAITNMPPPKNTRELKTYLGMLGYISKFIPNMSMITEPLRQLDRKKTYSGTGHTNNRRHSTALRNC